MGGGITYRDPLLCHCSFSARRAVQHYRWSRRGSPPSTYRENAKACRDFIHLSFVGVVAQIAPNPDVGADLAAYLHERLHDDRAGISDLAQRRTDFVPGQPAFAG